MNYSSSDEARYWAENLAESEGEAFEQAIKRIKPNEEPKTASKMLTMPSIKRIKPDDVIQRLTAENAELRDTVKIQSEQIKRLRECIARNQEEFYE